MRGRYRRPAGEVLVAGSKQIGVRQIVCTSNANAHWPLGPGRGVPRMLLGRGRSKLGREFRGEGREKRSHW